jgi:hypothetical protein
MARAHNSRQGQIGGFKVGDKVVTDFMLKPPYSGRAGEVFTLNHDAQEIGVEFGTHQTVWFYARELHHLQVRSAPPYAPESASTPEGGV